jgi:hypothetical protein
MDIVLDVAFVLAITAFLKEQFGLNGRSALAAAFLVALVFGFAPLVAGYIPTAAPFVDVVLKTIILFLGAAGSYDAVRGFAGKRK